MGTILTESDVFGGPVVHPNPQEIVSAAISMGAYRIKGTATPDGDLIFSGATNSNVRVRTLGGVSMALGIIVVGNDISIQLATDGLGNPTSLANAVVALYAGTPAAVALASVVAGGAGTGICGIQPVYMRIGDDDTGSIRPMMQNIINRTRYLYNRVIGILFATKSVKALYADGTGDLPVAPTAGSIVASNSMTAGNNVTAQNNVIALTGNVNAASGSVNALNNVNALTGDVIAANEVKGDHLQVLTGYSSATVPTSTNPLGNAGKGNVLAGAVQIENGTMLTYTIKNALNVAAITRAAFYYEVTFNFNSTTHYDVVSMYLQPGSTTGQANAYSLEISTSPLKIRVYNSVSGPGSNISEWGINLIVFAE